MPKRHELHNIVCKFNTLQCVRWGLNTQSLTYWASDLKEKWERLSTLRGGQEPFDFWIWRRVRDSWRYPPSWREGRALSTQSIFCMKSLSRYTESMSSHDRNKFFPSVLSCRTEYWLIPQCCSHVLSFRMCDMHRKRLNSKWIHPQLGRGFLFFCPCNSELPNGPEQFRYACLPLWSRGTQGCDVRNGGVEGEFQCLNSLSLNLPSISLIELWA